MLILKWHLHCSNCQKGTIFNSEREKGTLSEDSKIYANTIFAFDDIPFR